MSDAAHLFVLAGCNGSGKSTVLGASIEAYGGAYFNPDRVAKSFLEIDPSATELDGYRYAVRVFDSAFEYALDKRSEFAFETTLTGGRVRRVFEQAFDANARITVWFVGLDSAQQCKERIAVRVAGGGHPIEDGHVDRRFRDGPTNLATLLPMITTLKVFDNSESIQTPEGLRPRPRLVLAAHERIVVHAEHQSVAPDWSHPILARAFELWSQST